MVSMFLKVSWTKGGGKPITVKMLLYVTLDVVSGSLKVTQFGYHILLIPSDAASHTSPWQLAGPYSSLLRDHGAEFVGLLPALGSPATMRDLLVLL